MGSVIFAEEADLSMQNAAKRALLEIFNVRLDYAAIGFDNYH